MENKQIKQDIINLSLNELRQLVKEKVKSIEHSLLELAQILTYIKEKEIYKKWGFETFSDYVQLDLNMPKHKAAFYVNLCNIMQKIPLTQQDVTELGLEKIKQIISVSDKVKETQLNTIKEEAKQISVSELQKRVQKLKNSIPVDVKRVSEVVNELVNSQEENLVKCNLVLYESIYDLFSDTIERAQKICKTDSKNIAIEYICSVFNSITADDKDKDIISIVKRLEEIFNVKIVLVKGNKMIYGR